MKIINYLLLISLLFFSCSQKKTNEWRELECGLFMSPKGELAFASAPDIANISRTLLEPEQCPNYFITKFGWDDTIRISQIIDTTSFEYLGAFYYKDKNNIYSYYPMCDGGYLNIFKKDTFNFRIIGDWYAKDNKEVFYMRKGALIGVDYSSFESKEGWGQLAKDKNHYYSFGDTISKEEFYQHISN